MSIAAAAIGPKAKVMFLGTYHMNNPGLDLVKSQIRDTLGADRQREIQDLVARLAKFKPTKIAIELPADNKINERYLAYVGGGETLRANEIDQVAFRLGKQLAHSELYPVDYKSDMDFGKLMAFAAKEKQQWFLDLVQSVTGRIGKKMEELDRNFTVPQILAFHNSPAAIRFSHSLYLDMMKLNVRDEYPGVDVVADWYRRNMVIFSNIRRLARSPQERILVIFGAGHAKIIRDLISDSNDLELVEPSTVLPTAPEFSLE